MPSQLLCILGEEVEERISNSWATDWIGNPTFCVHTKGDEQILLPEEAEILRCVQQNAGDL